MRRAYVSPESMPTIGSSRGSQCALHGVDAGLVPLVERPLLDPFGPEESGLRQDPQVLARGGLADAQLLGDEHAAHAILDEIAIDLTREVRQRPLEPLENPKAPLVGERFDGCHWNHRWDFAKWLSLCQATTRMG